MAGLACARRLADAGQTLIVLDKGRGIGGRVATRREGTMQFDHGAQFVNAHNVEFAAVLSKLSVADWQDGRGRTHSVGVTGMSAIPKALGAGLDIRQMSLVIRLKQDGDSWVLDLENGSLRASRVVVTVPAPQVAGLLEPDNPLLVELAPVQLAPCLTLMAAVAVPPPFITLNNPDDPLSWIALDSSKPDRPHGFGALWVAQAGEAFSAAHIEKTPEEIATLMVPLLCESLGVAPDHVTYTAAHRWRYARVTQALGQPFLCNADGTLYLGGDWCIGPRVEAAWISGTAIVDAILAQG